MGSPAYVRRTARAIRIRRRRDVDVGLSRPSERCQSSIRRTQPGEEAAMSEYLILIYEDETQYGEAGSDVWREVLEAHNRFAEQIPELGGKLVGGNGLQPTATATSIRSDVVTDGPFAETKEALGGYYLVEARDLDHALSIAKLCPARFGGVEVRPVLEYPDE
jgi:hypothetical protein